MRTKFNKYEVLQIHNIPTFMWMFIFSGIIFLITFIDIRTNLIDFTPDLQEIRSQDNEKGYVIKTKGCKIPDLPITTSAIEKYFELEFDGAHCNGDAPPLVDSNTTHLFLIKDSISYYNITDKSLLHCCYEELKRKIPHHGESDQQYEFGDNCNDFLDNVWVEEEFVHVKCDYEDKHIYEDYFAFIPRKTEIQKFEKEEKISVLVIGIDGMSRINVHRQMPNFARTLETLGFQEFMGYNKIADNTYPNLIVVLTGKDEKTTDETCRKHGKYYDNCTFIWKKFKERNYTTSFAEDSAWMGIFNYLRYGFKHQPTDYIWGFFDRISEKLIGNSRDMNVWQCIGSREGYKMIVQYISDFVESMTLWKLPYFAFFWSSSLSHDDVNKPRIGDELYTNFITNLHAKGYFDNTVVIVMSDHGMRFGPYRQTYQGRIEERLPFLFVRLPDNFKKKFPLATSNLKINLRRLTTPFDLHETLNDLAEPQNLRDDIIANQNRTYSVSGKGVSLFRAIKPERTCSDAGIEDHWCTCLESSSIETNSDIAINITEFVVDYLNNLLDGYGQCETLRLKEVINAQIMSHSDTLFKSEVAITDYLINFVTVPGNGTFEATVRRDHDDKMIVVGTVSRLNLYGKQSACITDFHLKLYCYCRNLIW